MERSKIPSKRHNRTWWLAIACLVYGGIMIVLFLHFSFFVFFQERLPPPFVNSINETNSTAGTNFVARANMTGFHPRGELAEGVNHGFRMALAFQLFALFLAAVLLITAGIVLLNSVREHERKETHKAAVESMILPSEKAVIKELEEAGGELTQTELARRTGLSRVKAHRIVKRLEMLGVVSKHDYGMTNKIKLEKNLAGENKS